MSFNFALGWALVPRLLQGLTISVAVLFPSLILGALIALPLALARRSDNGLLSGAARLSTVFFQGCRSSYYFISSTMDWLESIGFRTHSCGTSSQVHIAAPSSHAQSIMLLSLAKSSSAA